MNRLVPLFRRGFQHKEYIAPMIRGAKKKEKAGGAEVPESNDFINIFKERKDPEIKDIEQYPVWLFELLGPQKNSDSVMKGWMYGHKHEGPEVQDVKTLVNQLQRYRIIDMNRYRQMTTGDLDRDIFDWGEKSIVKAEDDVVVEEAAEEEEDEDDE